MPETLLTLVVPDDITQQVQDLLLARPDLVRGFTASPAEGHGRVVQLTEDAELVAGHAPRRIVRLAGPEARMRDTMAWLKENLPQANIYYWLAPLLATGRL